MDRSKWEYKKLGEVCILLNGFAFKSEKYVDNGIRVMRITNVQKGEIVDDDPKFYPMSSQSEIQRYMLKENDLLVSLTGNVGRVGLLQRELLPAALNQRVACLRLKGNSTDLRYLFHLMNSNLFENECIVNSQGIAQKNMSTKWLSDYKLPVPPIDDQQRIVAELDCLNEMIAVKQEQLKEFDKLAQSIFYDMFGRGTSQQQWEHTTIGSISEEIKYGTSSPATPNGRYKYLRMNNMTNDGYLDLSDLKYIDVDANDYEKYVVRRGDVLFNRTNSRELVGKTVLFDFDEEMIIAGYIIRVRLKPMANPCFVVRYMNLPEQKEYLRGLCRGAIGQANINAKELQAIPIPLPPLSLQQQFADKISAIEAQKELVKQNIAETQHLLDYTMDKYFG